MKDRVAHAKEIIADLKAAGGWDLSGWEHFFAEEAAYVAPSPIEGLFRGQALFKIDGVWLTLAVTSISVSDHQEFIETVSIDGFRLARPSVRPDRRYKLECRFDDNSSTLAQHQGVADLAICVDDGVIVQSKIFVTEWRMESSFFGSPQMITIEMAATQ